MDEFKTTTKSADVAWKLFSESGEVGYYMLYKRLKQQEDDL